MAVAQLDSCTGRRPLLYCAPSASLRRVAVGAGGRSVGRRQLRGDRAVGYHPGAMPFTPISPEEFVQKTLRANPSMTRDEIEPGLAYAIAARRTGEQCRCGNPIWVAGSALAGLACFTCITGDATPDSDFEIAPTPT